MSQWPLWLVQEKADSQVQICGKNVPPHPCGEVQLTLHLPTRRQKGTQLSSSDSRVNPKLSVWRRPGPVIYRKERTTHGRAREQTERGGMQTGEVRKEERRVIEANPESLILRLFLVLPDFLSPSVTLALT